MADAQPHVEEMASTTTRPAVREMLRPEMIATVLLGLAALLSSWSTYQATRWSGVQAAKYSEGSRLRVEWSEMLAVAGQHRTVDVGAFSSWLTAYAANNDTLAEFYQRRLRPEFKVAFEKWIDSQPRKNPNAEPTPFTLGEYRLPEEDKAVALQASADRAIRDAAIANQVADDYVLTTVIFGMVLFLSGIAQQTKWRPACRGLLLLAAILCVVGASWLARFPIE